MLYRNTVRVGRDFIISPRWSELFSFQVFGLVIQSQEHYVTVKQHILRDVESCEKQEKGSV